MRRTVMLGVHITPAFNDSLIAKASTVGMNRSEYVRRVLERVVEGMQTDDGAHLARSLTERARGHLIAEAAKRGVTIPELVRELLEAIAESQLTNAVLDDAGKERAPA